MMFMKKEEYNKERGRVLAAETVQWFLSGLNIAYPYKIEHPKLPLLNWISIAAILAKRKII